MHQDSTPQGHQFKPMYGPRNEDLVELWVDMVTDSPPQVTSAAYISLLSPGLYRRICARIVHLWGVNLSLCTSLAITIWWSYVIRLLT
jgi:hypothetical protein